MFLVPLPGACLRLASEIQIRPSGTPGMYAMAPVAKWVSMALYIATAAYCIATSAFSLWLELRTFLVFKAMSAGKKLSHRDDFRLLVFAAFQFIGQLLMSVYCAMVLIAVSAGDTTLLALCQASYKYLVDILCFSGSFCLFFTSRHLRQRYLRTLTLSAHSSPMPTTSPIAFTNVPVQNNRFL
ncbi:hypothetical protein AAVH_28593 [Aphelenchoides avenae]|nr:hypothetical protein AAVH_28593 [Aphelenchus avenae]